MTTAAAERQVMKEFSRMWWLWLVAGIVWLIISVVVLQFTTTSAATIGIIFGVILFLAGLQYLFIGSIAEGYKWLWFVFGGLLVVGGLVSMFSPVDTFLALASVLGFIFVLIGALWIVEALIAREYNSLWWLGLVAGIVMVVMGFWLGGQFLITKAQTLLIFTGAYALMKGIIDLVLAFEVKKLGDV